MVVLLEWEELGAKGAAVSAIGPLVPTLAPAPLAPAPGRDIGGGADSANDNDRSSTGGKCDDVED